MQDIIAVVIIFIKTMSSCVENKADVRRRMYSRTNERI